MGTILPGSEIEETQQSLPEPKFSTQAEPFGADFRRNQSLTKKAPVLLALLALAALIVGSRIHTYNEPLERDITTYAVIAHEMLGGKSLYTDLWDHKPPAIHVTYAAAELIAGYGRNSIFLLSVAAAVLTMVACYFAGSAGGNGPVGGLIAATLWTLVSGDLTLEANQPNTEVFINVFLAFAFAAFVRTSRRSLGISGALVVGFCFVAASLYKQVALMEAAALAFVYLVWPPAGCRKRAFTEIAAVAGLGAISWLAVFGYFQAQHRKTAFIEATITYNQYYAGNIWRNLRCAMSLPPLPPEAFALLAPLAILCLTGFFFAISRRSLRPWIFLAGFALATHVAVLLPGQFFPHYYQLWLPVLAIGGGWTIAALRRMLPARSVWLSYIVAGIAVGPLLKLEIANYQMPANEWSFRKYGPVFLESDRLALDLNHLLKPDENFYEWGDETGLYFATKRQPPSGIFFADPILAGPLKNELRRRLMADLEKTRPAVLIVEYETLKRTRPSDPILSWVRQNYRGLSRTSRFLVLALKGSRLQREHEGKRAAAPPESANS